MTPNFPSAQKIYLDSKNKKISDAPILSEEKLKKIREEFNRELEKISPENFLYAVKEDLQESTNKKKYFVGSYTLVDKEWFLDLSDFIHHSVIGLGENFAQGIVHGREQLFIEELLKDPKNQKSIKDLQKFLSECKKKYGANHILICARQTIGWELMSQFDLHSSQTKSYDALLGEMPIFFSSFMPKGEIIICPKLTGIWHIKEKCQQPHLELIEPDSEQAQKIKEKYPEMDVRLKVLADAREFGWMEIGSDQIQIFKILNFEASDF